MRKGFENHDIKTNLFPSINKSYKKQFMYKKNKTFRVPHVNIPSWFTFIILAAAISYAVFSLDKSVWWFLLLILSPSIKTGENN